MATGKPIVDLQTDPQTVGELATGDTLLLNASAAAGAPLRVPPGTTPDTPIDGDIWETSAGIFARIAGVTYNLTDPDLVAVASSGIAAQWPLWTPTITSSTGTMTTTSATARYLQIGKLVHFWIIIALTDAGTGAGQLRFTLPTTANGSGIFIGRQATATAFFCAGFVNAASDLVSVLKLDETTVIATGRSVRLSGSYEST